MAVLEIAPANVLHGAVRLHGLTSSPTPDTHVRVACANTGLVAPSSSPSAIAAPFVHTLPIFRLPTAHQDAPVRGSTLRAHRPGVKPRGSGFPLGAAAPRPPRRRR